MNTTTQAAPLTTQEKKMKDLLSQVPVHGQYTIIINRIATKGTPDELRQLFTELKEHTDTAPIYLKTVIGPEAFHFLLYGLK